MPHYVPDQWADPGSSRPHIFELACAAGAHETLIALVEIGLVIRSLNQVHVSGNMHSRFVVAMARVTVLGQNRHHVTPEIDCSSTLRWQGELCRGLPEGVYKYILRGKFPVFMAPYAAPGFVVLGPDPTAGT